MSHEHGPSRATGEGQMIAFVEGLGSLRGRPRTAVRLVVRLALAVASVAVVLAAVDAVDRAFG
jgi:hypothetical protein